MSEIYVTVNGVQYSYDEAEKLGFIPKKEVVQIDTSGHSIEIIVDDDTRSFRLSVDDGEGVDIPKSLLIDIFEVSAFKSMKTIIEEDGVDEEILQEIAEKLNLL